MQNLCNTRPPYQELYIYYLEGRLAATVSLDAPDFIGNWEEDGFTFLFFACSADALINRLVVQQTGLRFIDRYRMSYEQWQGGKVTARSIEQFNVYPPWETCPDDDNDRIPLILDPGVVFGTGTHPTTRDCLKALDRISRRGSLKTVLDLGTGTGLLAIAAAKLGARQVHAVDFNLLAARTARRNVGLNRLDDRILVTQAKAEEMISRPCDLLIANIHYDVMAPLIAAPGFLTARWFILSGLLRSQAVAIKSRLADLPVQVLGRWAQDNVWFTFWGRRRGAEI